MSGFSVYFICTFYKSSCVSLILPITYIDAELTEAFVCTGGLLKLLLVIGKAYGALAQYDCRRAVQLFGELPEHQYNTAWVLTQIGRAYFEQGDFQKVRSSSQEK